jgi:pentatricopeptide repeat protein
VPPTLYPTHPPQGPSTSSELGPDDIGVMKVLSDQQTFLALLRSVERLSAGRQVHAHVVVSGLHSRVYLRNSLIKMYIDAGDVETTEPMFRSALVLDTVSCNIMISRYVNEGCTLMALWFFRDMSSRGIVVDQYTAVALLTCCGRLKNKIIGRSVLAH